MSTDTRIQSLESQVRTLRRAVCIMAGMLVVGVLLATTHRQAIPDVIQSKKFEVVADDGDVVVAIESMRPEVIKGVTINELPQYGTIRLLSSQGVSIVDFGADSFGNGELVTRNDEGSALVSVGTSCLGAGEVTTWNGMGRRLVMLATTSKEFPHYGLEANSGLVMTQAVNGELTSSMPLLESDPDEARIQPGKESKTEVEDQVAPIDPKQFKMDLKKMLSETQQGKMSPEEARAQWDHILDGYLQTYMNQVTFPGQDIKGPLTAEQKKQQLKRLKEIAELPAAERDQVFKDATQTMIDIAKQPNQGASTPVSSAQAYQRAKSMYDRWVARGELSRDKANAALKRYRDMLNEMYPDQPLPKH